MNSHFNITLPDCDSCGREATQIGYYRIESDTRYILIDAGLFAGDPIVAYGNKTNEELAKAFTSIRNKLLKEAYGYMSMLRNNREVREGSYERLVFDLTRFIELLLQHPTAIVTID